MKVLHINNTDSLGGAARACNSIHHSLLSIGINSKILVQYKNSNEKEIFSITNNSTGQLFRFYRKVTDYLFDKFYSNDSKGRFSIPSIGANIFKDDFVYDADILHFHWINENYISFDTLAKLVKLNKPIVWTLHDMWAFTGGCHYSMGCIKYKSICSSCPGLKRPSENDITEKIFNRKRKLYEELNLNIITCSKWLCETAKNSSLLKDISVTSIPNPINIELFQPKNKNEVRRRLNLPSDKFLILFGTMTISDSRKGASHLLAALKILADKYPKLKEKIELVVFGAKLSDYFTNLPFSIHSSDRILSDDLLVDYYNCADLFAAPSIEDNLPNTVMESLSCGVPVIAFNIGGMPDMIDHTESGFLVKPFSAENFAEGINWIYKKTIEGLDLSNNSRTKVISKFTPNIVAQRYKSIYETLL